MKIYSILTIAFAAFALGACDRDKDFVEIDSLQVFGDEFFQGAVVELGMSARTSNPYAYYEWFCDAGSLRMTQQGYTVMRWTAPKESGEYTVGCTVTCGDAKATRIARIKVSGLFFERFPGTITGWSKSGNTPSLDLFNGRLTAQVNPTANTPADSLGNVYRGLGVADFFPPASITALVGVVSEMQNTNNPKFPETAPLWAWATESGTPPAPVVKIWSVGDVVPANAVETRQPVLWDNFLGFGLTGNAPDAIEYPNYYISEVRVDWWPVAARMQNTLSYYSVTDNPRAELPPSTINASEFNARVAVRWTLRQDLNFPDRLQSQSGWFMIPFKSEAFNQAPGVAKTVGIAVAEDYTVNVMVDREIVYTTDGLKVWRNTHELAQGTPFKINEVKYVYPKRTRIFLDDVVATDTETFAY